jgi:hypothetical protein
MQCDRKCSPVQFLRRKDYQALKRIVRRLRRDAPLGIEEPANSEAAGPLQTKFDKTGVELVVYTDNMRK